MDFAEIQKSVVLNAGYILEKWKEKNGMRKVSSLILMFVLMLALSGCKISRLVEDKWSSHYDPFYAETVDSLLKYIDDGDKDGVKSLLCNGLKNSKDIDAKIEALVEGFEGDIVRTTKHDTNTFSAGSAGKNYNSAFLSQMFYIITDKQKYGIYVAVCPIDEKDEEGEDLIGIYNVYIRTLDYQAGDIKAKEVEEIKIANHICRVTSNYGDSSNYLVAQTGTKFESIDLYRIINPQSIVTYDDITAWTSRDFSSFQDKFGSPYAENLDNASEHVAADVYIYEISDSDKYAIVAVGRESGVINALSVVDIDSPWSKESQYERIIQLEKGSGDE